MTKNRLEAFSDGVIAIIITIMVLEFKSPETADWAGLRSLMPTLASYVLSFVYVGIYWGNHHHLLHGVRRISGGIIWANMNLLFWLSLVPFTTAWMGNSQFAPFAVAVYGGILFTCGFAYDVLRRVIDACHPEQGQLKQALNKQAYKGIVSLVAYGVAIPCAFWSVWASNVLYVFVAILWLIPDKNIERALRDA